MATQYEHLTHAGFSERLQGTAAPLRAGIRRFFTTTADWFGDVVHSLQIARMQSVLAEMEDDQLKVLGIERHQIATHAERLIGPRKKET